MDERLRNYWNSELRVLFPKHAEFKSIKRPEHYEVVVSWKINTDLKRPHKRSKTIRIIVPKEAVDDYESKSEAARIRDDKKLKQLVANNLTKFNPDHAMPKDVTSPEVIWVADSNVLDS